MILRMILPILLLSYTSYSLGSSALKSYKFSGFAPKASLEQCQTALSDVAARFIEQASAYMDTEIGLFDAACQKDHNYYEGYDATILYRSTSSVPIHSTKSSSIYSEGGYVGLDSCLNDLDNATAHFENATGLTALHSYCFHEGGSGDHKYYAARIDAIGHSEIKKYVSGAGVPGTPENPYEFLGQVKTAIADRGFDVISVYLTPDIGWYHLNVSYYGDSRWWLSIQSMDFESKQQCLINLAKVKSFLKDEADDVVGYDCGKRDISYENPLNIILFSKKFRPEYVLPVYHYGLFYETREECEQKAGDLEDDPDLYGAICTYKDEGFYITGFVKPE